MSVNTPTKWVGLPCMLLTVLTDSLVMNSSPLFFWNHSSA